jgi:hypothetical protein
VNPRRRGALAGAIAAALWTATDPVTKRLFGTPYSDSELLSSFVTRGPWEPVVGAALHATVGAGFGYTFARFGGRGVRAGIAVALAENTLLWPGLAVFDRIHPKRRDGTWPKLVDNPRVFAQATAGHAFFGAVLGALGPRC